MALSSLRIVAALGFVAMTRGDPRDLLDGRFRFVGMEVNPYTILKQASSLLGDESYQELKKGVTRYE